MATCKGSCCNLDAVEEGYCAVHAIDHYAERIGQLACNVDDDIGSYLERIEELEEAIKTAEERVGELEGENAELQKRVEALEAGQ